MKHFRNFLFCLCLWLQIHFGSTLNQSVLLHNFFHNDHSYECGWLEFYKGNFNRNVEKVSYITCLLQWLSEKEYRLIHSYKKAIHTYEDHVLREPPLIGDKFVILSILDPVITKIELGRKETLTVTGRIKLKWLDFRLIWNDDYETKRFTQKTITFDQKDMADWGWSKPIWMPQFVGFDGDTFSHPMNRWRGVNITNEGKVVAIWDFSSPVECDYNLANYPFDKVICNMFVRPEHSNVDFETFSSKFQAKLKFIEDIKAPPGFELAEIVEKFPQKRLNFMFVETHAAVLDLQITLKRNFALIHKILITLLLSAVILGIFGPLSGCITGIIASKLISLLLTTAGLTIFALHNPDVIRGRKQPNFVKAFEFSMVLTIISLLATFILWNIHSAVIGKLPPPHWIQKLANKINTIFCWMPRLFGNGLLNQSDSDAVRFEVENGELKMEERQNKFELNTNWSALGNAIHSLLFVIFAAIYVIGLSILSSFE